MSKVKDRIVMIKNGTYDAVAEDSIQRAAEVEGRLTIPVIRSTGNSIEPLSGLTEDVRESIIGRL